MKNSYLKNYVKADNNFSQRFIKVNAIVKSINQLDGNAYLHLWDVENSGENIGLNLLMLFSMGITTNDLSSNFYAIFSPHRVKQLYELSKGDKVLLECKLLGLYQGIYSEYFLASQIGLQNNFNIQDEDLFAENCDVLQVTSSR